MENLKITPTADAGGTSANTSSLAIPVSAMMPNVVLTTAANEAQGQQTSQTAGQLAYANLTKLRSAADKYLSTVIAQGRKAKLELVGKIYAEYFAVMNCNETAALVAKVEQQLTAEKIAYRSNTPAGTKLVRFVFSKYNDEDLTSKEAFQYSRGMDVAFEQDKKPAAFEAFVVANGGFAGIMKSFPVASADSSATGNAAGAVKLEDLRQSPTACEIAVEDWADGEAFRVYIAVRSDDTDEGMLKVMHASKEAIEKFIAICEAERKASDKPAKDVAAKKKKLAKLALEGDLQNAEIKLLEIKQELKKIKPSHDEVAIAKLNGDVAVQNAVVVAVKADLKAIKAKKDTKTTA
jgi:hypothetical protein